MDHTDENGQAYPNEGNGKAKGGELPEKREE